MSYVVLARKWRPMSFEDLVGQEHVSRTLQNAIGSGRVAHAFLFTGVRGVGKTTAARILAKALNCLGREGTASGPTATPCLGCAACREITAGTDVDVREIDGASYTGVDDVRKLQDSIPYRPTRDRSKIFIVDEVHMLSQNAWNAFLKTLEEPPPHVKFIFATTEVHKVPVTILSRVQRFDFKLIPSRLIGERLKHVLREEGIGSDEQAIALLARQAAGSMRDAMSLLDQVIAWSDARLDGDSVARVLGVASHTVLYDLVRGIVDADPARCLGIVSDLANQGFDLPTVARDLLALLRDLVVSKVCADPSGLLDLPEEEKRDIAELSARSDADDLLRLHQGFSQGFDEVVRSGQPRAALEMLLVRLSRRPALLPVDDSIARLGNLERKLGGGAPPRTSGPSGGGGPRAPARSAEPAPARRPTGQRADGEGEGDKPLLSVPPAPVSVPVPSARAAPPVPSDGPSVDPVFAASAPNGAPMQRWGALVERVRSTRPDLAAFLQHVTPVTIDRERLVLGFEPGGVAERIRDAESVRVLTVCAEEFLGARPKVTFEALAARGAEDTISRTAERERQAKRGDSLAKAKSHPRIAEVSEILGARLKEIQLPPEE